MTSTHDQRIACRVVGGEKLPADSGGPTRLCAAIERAAAARPALKMSVVVRVVGKSALAATLTTASGKVLPEQKYAISDRTLDSDAFDRFAKSLVEVATASTH